MTGESAWMRTHRKWRDGLRVDHTRAAERFRATYSAARVSQNRGIVNMVGEGAALMGSEAG
jgi:hypothetical protein